jgi:hypothetical protein
VAGQTSGPGTKTQSGLAETAELKPHPMYDNKKQVMSVMTLPATWQLHSEPGKAFASGPGGISVWYIPVHNFMYTQDPMMASTYRQAGGKLRQPIHAVDVVHNDLEPIARKDGSKLIKVYNAPDIAKADAGIQDMMYHIGPSNTGYEAAVSEWQDKDGNPYSIVVHLTRFDMGNSISWSYYAQGLDAPKEKFDAAQRVLLKGLASLQYNPRYFDKYNQGEMAKEASSWAAYRQRMDARQRSFDAQQAAFKERSEAINNSIMASYKANDEAGDHIQNRFLNYIKDENTVTNTADGSRHQVQTGKSHYWVDENGNYIGTDDPNYDPNRNQGPVTHQWNEGDIEN